MHDSMTDTALRPHFFDSWGISLKYLAANLPRYSI